MVVAQPSGSVYTVTMMAAQSVRVHLARVRRLLTAGELGPYTWEWILDELISAIRVRAGDRYRRAVRRRGVMGATMRLDGWDGSCPHRHTHKACECGRRHTLAGWGALAYVGSYCDEVVSLEMRRCECGSTLSVEYPR
jgi:hypothetical protein